MKFDGRLLRKARQEKGYKVKELAWRISLSEKTVAKYEARAACPSADTLANLTVVLEQPLGYFYSNNNE